MTDVEIDEEEIVMEVVVYHEPDNFVCVPRGGKAGSDFKVLEQQIAKYTSVVTAPRCPYFPGDKDICFGRVKQKQSECVLLAHKCMDI